MASFDLHHEFVTDWLPHATDAGLARIIELLATNSPLLISGSFTRACAMGCLATHIAWHHPKTAHLNDDAGIQWLTRIAKLNPATSAVILAWDRSSGDWSLRAELLDACRLEMSRRTKQCVEAVCNETPAITDVPDFQTCSC